ncbi:SpoIIE family protein phosphatase [Kitasatospora sp. NPDC056138]|uniref:SpoIIE family protein phosphatase n=1 Tax=Kitasatospora sp. NPDC056138 TaxID=3345724 RepID=UPI0035E0926A
MSDDSAERAVLQATVDRLRAEADGLRAAMRTRGVIEQAKGLLTERLSCTPDQAFEELVRRSQESNRKLVELAAELLGLAAPPGAADPVTTADPLPESDSEPRPRAADPTPPTTGVRASGHPPAAASEPATEGFATRYHLAASALASAAGPDDLARQLHEYALAPLGAAAVVLALLEPDGALRLVGSHGVPAHQLSQWQRIPPRTAVPLTEAAQLGTTVWVHSREEFAARYPDLTGEDLIPGRTVCAEPLRTGRRLIGAMKLGWTDDFRPDPGTTRYLSAVARLTAAQLLRMVSADTGGPSPPEPSGEPWFRAVLDALLDPVLILAAVREPTGEVTDLRVEHANAATVDLADRTGEDIVGHRVTELYPGMVASGTFRRLLDVAATGTPYQGRVEQFLEVVGGTVHASTMTLHATPFLDGVLVSWRTHDEQERQQIQLAQAQRLAGLGTWSWQRGSTRIGCSPELGRLLGLPEESDGLDLRTVLAAISPDDRDGVRAVAERLLAGQSPATAEFQVTGFGGLGGLGGPGGSGAPRGPADARRSLRAMAEAVPGAVPGVVVAIRGVVQDVTAWRRTEQALSDARSRLADQRRQTAVEHRAVRTLQHALMDVPRGPHEPDLEVAVRYLPAERESKVGGDWYDVLSLPDRMVLVVVGDVSGHGLRAAAGMAQLRHALRGMAYTGLPPDEVLGRLNRMLCHERSEYIATAVCGLLDPATRTLGWARAGHLPPVVAQDGAVRLLDLPDGLVLGAEPSARYGTARLRLPPGRTVLLYTDGLVERRGDDLGRGLDRLLRAVEEYRAPELEGCLDHVLRRLGAPNPLDDTCLVGLRLR